MTIEFHVWIVCQRETITSIRRFIQAKSTQDQKQRAKLGGNSQQKRAGQVQKKKTDLEILTSPKGGLYEKYLWKILDRLQINERLKEGKKKAYVEELVILSI